MALPLIADAESPIPEDALNEFAKNISKIPKTPSEVNERRLGKTLTTLSETAYSATLSSSHRTAACNALCGFALQLQSVPHGTCIIEARRHSLCDSILDIYVDRNDGARQKSMEQLLSTLIKLLQIEAKDSVTKPITISCLRRFCNIVFKAHDRVKAKCSLHALTLFVSRGSIRWQELLDEYKSIVGVPGESSPLQSFLLEIFEWASFADAAPGVGQLSHAFYKAYTAELAHSTSSCDETPLWVAPLLSSIRRYPGSLRDFKNHVFPGLFGLDSRNFWSFLHALNLETHLGLAGGGRKRIPRYERVLDADAERMVLFNALEVGKECGMIRQDGRDFTTNAKKSLTNTVCTEDVHDAASITFRDGCVVLPTTGLAHLLSSRSPEARLAGLTLTVLSKQSTKPLTSHELHLLRLSIPQLIMDTDQNFRSEVVSIFQSLTYRLRSIFASLRRYESSLCHDGSEYQYDCTTPPFLRSNWNKHMRFVIWWRDYLQKQLKTSVSYQRHIAALKALRVLAQSGLDPRVSETRLAKRARSDIKWPFQLQVITAMGHRVLLDLLLDSFDDVRQGALNLLKAVAGKEIDYLLPLARAKSLLQQSGRVDFADGFARLIDLQATTRGACILSDGTEASKHTTEHTVETLDRLSIMQDAVIDVNNGLQVAESSFSDAVEKYPIHGQLIALRYTLEGMGSLVSTPAVAISLCPVLNAMLLSIERVWSCTAHVLCNDAPEGFVSDEAHDEHVISTKDVSSYSWRSVKEASLLLRAVVTSNLAQKAFVRNTSWTDILRSAGELCFTQLANLRHRGAFSTVAQTFSAVCARCVESGDSAVSSLLHNWLEKTLGLIHEKGSATTRRSAGIPALLAGLCNAEPAGPMADRVMGELESIAVQPTALPTSDSATLYLPQVHAINSLKNLLAQPKLVEAVEKYLVRCARLAADSITSPIWAIRNVGLILFRGTIDRLLGSNEKLEDLTNAAIGAESRLSYDRYPGLIELVVELLESFQAQSETSQHSEIQTPTAEAVFAVLDLLRRAPPSSEYRRSVQGLILHSAGTTHWHIRELSSRAFTASMNEQHVVDMVKDLLDVDDPSQNVLHGRLLCVKHLIRALFSSEEPLKMNEFAAIYQILISQQVKIFVFYCVEAVKAAYIDCLNSVLECIVRLQTTELQHDSLTQALTFESISSARAFEGLPAGNSLLRKALEVNGWLAHLAFEKLESFVTQDDQELVVSLHKAIMEPSQDIEVSSGAIEYTAEVVQSSENPTKSAFLAALVRFARSNPRMSSCCHSALCSILLSFASNETASVMGVGPVAQYLRSVDVVEDMRLDLSPSQAQVSLVTMGFALCVKLSVPVDTRVHCAALGTWIKMVQSSLQDDVDFDLRKAAVESLLALSSTPSYSTLPSTIREQVSLTLYDALHDDDPDLREIAAEAAWRMLASIEQEITASTARVAPVAAERLLETLGAQHTTSQYLFDSALERVTGQRWNALSAVTHTSQVLRQLLDHKVTLFDVEKQNLYRDDAYEAEVWSSMLMRMSLETIAPATISAFAKWTVDGIDALTAQTQKDYDGPLGWTCKEEVFVLGMRIICAAKVVLAWRQRSRKVPIRASDVRRNLRVLADVGEAQALHPIWLQCIQKILERSVRQRLQRVAAMLASIEANVVSGQKV